MCVCGPQVMLDVAYIICCCVVHYHCGSSGDLQEILPLFPCSLPLQTVRSFCRSNLFNRRTCPVQTCLGSRCLFVLVHVSLGSFLAWQVTLELCSIYGVFYFGERMACCCRKTIVCYITTTVIFLHACVRSTSVRHGVLYFSDSMVCWISQWSTVVKSMMCSNSLKFSVYYFSKSMVCSISVKRGMFISTSYGVFCYFKICCLFCFSEIWCAPFSKVWYVLFSKVWCVLFQKTFHFS